MKVKTIELIIKVVEVISSIFIGTRKTRQKGEKKT